MSRDFELGSISVQFANAFAIAITFARWRRRRSEATAVTYEANFYPEPSVGEVGDIVPSSSVRLYLLQ